MSALPGGAGPGNGIHLGPGGEPVQGYMDMMTAEQAAHAGLTANGFPGHSLANGPLGDLGSQQVCSAARSSSLSMLTPRTTPIQLAAGNTSSLGLAAAGWPTERPDAGVDGGARRGAADGVGGAERGGPPPPDGAGQLDGRPGLAPRTAGDSLAELPAPADFPGSEPPGGYAHSWF